MDLSLFKCKCCGACCRIKGIVRLSSEDVDRISEYLGIGVDFFLEKYTTLAPDRSGLILTDGDDGQCIMLTEENLCRINPVKPQKCKTFPYDWVNSSSMSYCPALNECDRQGD